MPNLPAAALPLPQLQPPPSGDTTPLEVMLMAMNALVAQAHAPAPEGMAPAEAAQLRLKALVAAADLPKNAAPYLHPRLSTVEPADPEGAPPPEVVTRVELVAPHALGGRNGDGAN